MLDDKPRLKMMADKLYLEIQHSRINNEFAEQFITDVRDKLARGVTLTDKQESCLEKLFERY